ncbi:hypothetical protein F5Y18DRAFT_3901 [Xylariaceae sp. FL1019]|nr:hypothetical protein F5Y18DRAFT_3901 [Xylariaceae sp. FL1019]
MWWNRPDVHNSNNYEDFGDAYNDELYEELASKWAIDTTDRPYLAWVKNDLAENGWHHLRLLADFMSIGTVPQRWKEMDPKADDPLRQQSNSQKTLNREKRFKKTKVSVLDYYETKVHRHETVETPKDLRQELDRDPTDGVQFKLFVVEDLSSDVIEILGQKLKIEPDVFRAHIADFAWYNVLDRWRDPPVLDVVSRSQNWMQMRYVTIRYFEKHEHFKEAVYESMDFNILRRPDDDQSNKAFWDRQGAVVGLTRSRATFWLQPEDSQSKSKARIGVLLLDPTVTTGSPLWRGRRACWPTPEYPSRYPENPPKQGSFFDDFVFWAQQQEVFHKHTGTPPSRAHVPIQVLLHLISSEWLQMSDYIKTRLNQLDWELVKPDLFRQGKRVDDALEKLHMWRRFIPLYREMVTETIQHVRAFPYREFQASISRSQSPMTPDYTRSWTGMSMSSTMQGSDQGRFNSIGEYETDFRVIQARLDEHQQRIDRLTTVVTAAMTIEDSRLTLQDNHNIGRLTWLATFFIPFSLIAGVLSMQPDVGEISGGTFLVYFATSVPLSILIFFIGLTISQQKFKKASLKATNIMKFASRPSLW